MRRLFGIFQNINEPIMNRQPASRIVERRRFGAVGFHGGAMSLGVSEAGHHGCVQRATGGEAGGFK